MKARPGRSPVTTRDYAGARSLIPDWAQDLGKIAKSVGKDILRNN